jgi:glycosyltransferase involved in cell wall biosynthesis
MTARNGGCAQEAQTAGSTGVPLPKSGSPKPLILFIVPGSFDRPTGGSIYNRHVAESLKRSFLVEIVSVPDLPYAAGLLAGILVSPWLLLKALRLRPDLVVEDAWAHPPLVLFNFLIGSSARSRLVLIAHLVRWRMMRRGRLARRIEAAALRRASLVIVVSRFVGREVEKLCKGLQIVVARPGSDRSAAVATANDKPEGSEPLKLLFAGSCVRQKGVEDLIKAMALLADLPLRLDLAGSDDIAPRFSRKLKRMTLSLGLAERVRFHGFVASPALARFYSSADIFVFPSHYEGYGIVLAEAMRAGLPIVVSDIGPAVEIVAENENAFLVPVQNPGALAGAIRKLADDPGIRARFGRRSRELATSLPAWRDTCNAVLEAISRL